MRRRVFVRGLVLLVFGVLLLPLAWSLRAEAGPPAQILALTLTTSQGVYTVKATVGVSRGVDTAARTGRAPFVLDLTFTFQSGVPGVWVTETAAVPVNETVQAGQLDQRTFVTETVVPLVHLPDKGAVVTATARIMTTDPGTGEALEVGDPSTTLHQTP